MLLWVMFAVLSAAVTALLLQPLLRVGAAAPATEAARDSAIYRDQLNEVEAERERGLIGAAEAETARAEIARRLIAAEDRAGAAEANDTGFAGARAAAAVIAVALPLAAIALYARTGSPSLPDQPLAARNLRPAAGDDIGRLIAAVEARLKAHPEDGQGWDVIAPVYLRLGRYAEAADAFARAIRLLGESSIRLAGLAEATVLASDGIVTEAARATYEKLAKLEPERVEPRFWLALAKEQDGKLDDALAAYLALLREGPADAPWRPLVTERIDAVRARLGLATGPASPPAAPTRARERGPTTDDVAAANKLSAAERQRMIDDMVQGLADRLARDGRDLAGWQRLIRAYTVMGRKAEAIAALGRARNHFGDEPQSLAALSELAKALGLES